MRIAIIGAGISGLAAGQLLKDKFEIEILEGDNKLGGIAKTKTVDGIAYHIVGGHCFNSKYKNVMNFVFNHILSKNNWHKCKRTAKILINNNLINYPIEFSLKEIAKFDFDLSFKMAEDYFKANYQKAKSLSQWFVNNFGETLANEYFIPYNKKIWGIDPAQMSASWVSGKLPIPNKKDVFKALIGSAKDNMPHSSFYYPNSNNQNTFIEAMSKGLSIKINYMVESIEESHNKWLINGEKYFDIIISTAPLNKIPFIIKCSPEDVREKAKKLNYNRVTNMLWTTNEVNSTWIYYPSNDTIFHRNIFIGNFFLPRQNFAITESLGVKHYHEMIKHGQKIPYLKDAIDFHVSDYAYVVFDKNYKDSTSHIKKYLKHIGIYTLGRFGEWNYYNMDMCIKSAMVIAKTISLNYA